MSAQIGTDSKREREGGGESESEKSGLSPHDDDAADGGISHYIYTKIV